MSDRPKYPQDPDYLAPARDLIRQALGDDQAATAVLDALAAAGWRLLNREDFEKALDAYVMQAIR